MDSGATRNRAERAEPHSTLLRPAERAALVISGALLLASLALTVHPWYEARPDASLYLSTARSLAAGEGYTYLGEPYTLRPPGFPLLVAGVIELAGLDFFALHLLVSGFGVLGVAALCAWLLPRVGVTLAIATACCVWLNPEFQRLCNNVMSDVPGAAGVLLCLLLDGRARARPSLRSEGLLGIAIGLVSLLRTASLLLIPAIALARFLDAPGRRSAAESAAPESRGPTAALRVAVCTGAALLLALPWLVYATAAAPQGAMDQTKIHSYATAMLHEDQGDPHSRHLGLGEILGRAPLRARQIVEVLGSRLQLHVAASPGEAEAGGVRGSPLFAAALLGALALQMLRRRGAAEGFAVASLLVLLFYFGFGGRLLLPIYLIALASLVEVARDAATAGLGGRVATPLVAVAVLALGIHDASRGSSVAERERTYEALIAELSAVDAQLPENARVGTVRAFDYNALLERRFYSLHRAALRHGVERGVEATVERYALDTLVVGSTRNTLSRDIANYLGARYGEPQLAGGASIWRVRSPGTRIGVGSPRP